MMTRIAAIMTMVTMSFLVAGAAATAEAGNPGMVVLATGGGSIEDAPFNRGGAEDDATFSFHVGYDKHGKLKGSLFYKRVYPGAGVRAVKSTEITYYDVGFDVCPWVEMRGRATVHATWVNKPILGEYFDVIAWDCDGVSDVPDMIWFGEYRSECADLENYPEACNWRPALTLFDYFEPTGLAGGNIMIH